MLALQFTVLALSLISFRTVSFQHPLGISQMRKTDINRLQMKVAFFTPPSSVSIKKLVNVNVLNFSKIKMSWRALILLITAYLVTAKTKMKNQLNLASTKMEMGWSSRGTGSSLSRTLEVWIFAFTFLWKYVI
jgi:hypothetical protein